MIIGRGAEAVLKKEGDSLVKERIKKGYRIDEIDMVLRRDRTVKEARILVEARRNKVSVPAVLSKDKEKMTIEMEYIEGPVLRDELERLSKTDRKNVCQNIGQMVARLHKANLIHGDLTTSNMILKGGKVDQLFFIDFGLGYFSPKVEDKAVDLHLLKQALISKHNSIWKESYETIMKSYSGTTGKDAEAIKARITKIEKRGRYSH